MSSRYIIEIDDSDSDVELIDMTSRSTSTSSSTLRSEDENHKKRKRESAIEVISSDDDDEEEIRSQLRELSVQVDNVGSDEKQKATLSSSFGTTPFKRHKPRNPNQPSTSPSKHKHHHHHSQTQTATTPQPNTKYHLTWAKDAKPIHAEKQSIYGVDGFEEKCTKIYRKGLIHHDNVEFSVDNAIVLPHHPPLYALIRSIFALKFDDVSIKDKHFAHVHYLKSPNSNVSGSRAGELYLRNAQCQDIPIKQILKGKKLDFELTGGIKGKRRGNSKYFCQFVDQPSLSTIREPMFQDRFDRCDSCASRHQKHNFDDPRLINDTLHLGDDEYHLNDFIAIDTKVRGRPFLIGQVHDWIKDNGGLIVRMRRLERFSEVVGDNYDGFVSNQRLVVTDEYDNHPVKLIMVKVYVFLSEEDAEHVKRDISFWCSERITDCNNANTITALQKPLRVCSTCLESAKQQRQDLEDCLRACRFSAADYYSGAGGFILPGLNIFEWVSATDTDKVACQTLHHLKREAPQLSVHYGKVSDIYHYTTSHDSPTNNPKAFPSPGTVFLMTGGPPCQGHSRVNHANNPSAGKIPDPRNDELWVMLAEVFRLRPYVVIIENVSAFKDDKSGNAGVPGEDNYGRAAMKELSQNGYACRLGIIDSRSYGTPQNRLRTFILGVRVGLPLPDFPAPTHANPKPTATVFKTDKAGSLKPFYLGSRATPGTGLHLAVTIKDAVSEFPAFEYLPPPGISRIPRRPQIPAFDGGRNNQQGNDTKVGFAHRIRYSSTALNDYQTEKRGDATSLNDHYTSYVTDGAKKIIFTSARDPKSQGCDRRALYSEGFSTLLTNSSPGQKGTAVIHPSQDRKFTIAERKRAMGWPDWHRLAGTPLDQDRQTGNGVCFESVQANYMALVKEIILPWWIEAGRPTENVFEKFKMEHP
ncbi:uncharacterized protein L199_003135 [Kwoniella botswanensis]|uniref:uncharacterized protein n=1 Tax=Kwoniella botswanensis TaxID=1268659 RepID=UPI00315D607A